jgi:hypothetical protein
MTPTDHISTLLETSGSFSRNVYGGRYQYVPTPWEVKLIRV